MVIIMVNEIEDEDKWRRYYLTKEEIDLLNIINKAKLLVKKDSIL